MSWGPPCLERADVTVRTRLPVLRCGGNRPSNSTVRPAIDFGGVVRWAITLLRRSRNCRSRWSVAGRVKAATAASAASVALRRPVRSRRIGARSDAASTLGTEHFNCAVSGPEPCSVLDHLRHM